MSPGKQARLRKRCRGKFAQELPPEVAAERQEDSAFTRAERKARRIESRRGLVAWARDPNAPPLEHLSVAGLPLPVRILNALDNHAITTIGDLTSLSPGELVDRAHLDGAMLDQVTAELAKWERRLQPPRAATAVIDSAEHAKLETKSAQQSAEIERLEGIIRYERQKSRELVPEVEAKAAELKDYERRLKEWWAKEQAKQQAVLAAAVERAERAERALRAERAAYSSPKPDPTIQLRLQAERQAERARRLEEELYAAKAELKHRSDPGRNYPRMMFHATLPPVTVESAEEEAALGASWSRIYRPPVPDAPPIVVPAKVDANEALRQWRELRASR